jgi:hypothetical protein
MSENTTVDLTKSDTVDLTGKPTETVDLTKDDSKTETVDLTKPPEPNAAVANLGPMPTQSPAPPVAPVENIADEPEEVQDMAEVPDPGGVPRVEKAVPLLQKKPYRPMNLPPPRTNPVHQLNPAFAPRVIRRSSQGRLQDPPQAVLLTDKNGNPREDRIRADANRANYVGQMKEEEQELLEKIALAKEDLKYNADALRSGKISLGQERDLKGVKLRIRAYEDQIREIRQDVATFLRLNPDLRGDVYSRRGIVDHKSSAKESEDEDVKSTRIEGRKIKLELDDLNERLRSPQGLSDKERARLIDLTKEMKKNAEMMARVERRARDTRFKHEKRERELKEESDYMGRKYRKMEEEEDSSD